MARSVYRDIIIGKGKVRYVHWWNRWYWKRHSAPYQHDGVERYLMPRIRD